MATEIEEILRRTASLVNAAEGVAMGDQALKPHVMGAHWSVINELGTMGSSDLLYRVELTITPSDTGLLISPTMPSNIVVPRKLWEKNGTDDEWLEMQLTADIPANRVAQERMFWWNWRNQQLWVPEVTVTTTLRVDYEGGPLDLTMPRDQIEVVGLSEPIAWRAAANACMATGDATRAQLFDHKAKELLTIVANQNTRMRQGRPVKRYRRRPGIPIWR